jgi:hypothetical protein
MMFEADVRTLFRVRCRQRYEEIRAVIPVDYFDVMMTDQRRGDGALIFDDVHRLKCPLGGSGNWQKALRPESLEPWHRYHDGTGIDYTTETKAL